ncbi:MAG: (d)CMP kinase [Alphaproteobacteria bacterium]|nr:MAG: (d)CMP kinase [Alphaproteobacteria bacterium]
MSGQGRAFTVAIDGPAASGKGTIARAIAERFGFAHLDTGLLYRAVAARTLEGEDPVAAARALTEADLARPDLRSERVAARASEVAAMPEVRAVLREWQRRFARRPGGAVLDGRDIGTVICPEAEVKLYVTASPEVRAERRWRELRARGEEVPLEQVLAEVRARDARDMGRADSPLRPAPDAVILDTTALGIDEAVAAAERVVQARLEGKSGEAGPGS